MIIYVPPKPDPERFLSTSIHKGKHPRKILYNVWAIEKRYRTFYGEPILGYDHYVSRTRNVKSATSSNSDPVKYILMTTVPWNWIPFIPVHTTEFLSGGVTVPPTHMYIELQRAAMINPITGTTTIKPNSRLLNEVQPHYYIDESEIPRAGVIYSYSGI